MDINFWGVVYGTKAFLPHLKASGEGHVVNVSSVFGLISVPSQSAYNAAKFAVRGFTDALRMELEIDGDAGVGDHDPPRWHQDEHRQERPDRPQPPGPDRRPEKARRDFEKAFVTSPEKAARQILTVIQRDRRRALVGPDAKVVDFVARLPVGFYQRIAENLAKAAGR